MALTAAAAAGWLLAGRTFSATETTVSALAKETHFHGLAVDPRDPSRLYLATHHGLYAVATNGTARRLSEVPDDFMGFTPHPADPGILFASGHPVGGGNLGFITSTDGGRSWVKLSDGIGGPVDFHQLDVSRADPRVIYGVYGELQVSGDGGHTWEQVGPVPDGLIDLAASATDAATLYAATKNGFFLSKNGGRTWRDAYIQKRPATLVATGTDGDVYAFVVGVGLLRATEPNLSWSLVNNDFGEGYVIHLAIHPTDTSTLYAVTHKGEVLASTDGGQTWSPIGSK